MKKIILILFLFLLCIACYFIYYKTKTNQLYITSIGDELASYKYISLPKIKKYNTDFTSNDLKINDMLNMLKQKYENEITPTLHQTLKKSDILILSIGQNDIYYKLNDNTKEIYTYLNNIINTYEEVLKEISKYSYKEVFIFGYYNIKNDNNDLFNYVNYKLEKLAQNYHYTFIDLNKTINYNPKYLQKAPNYHLNKLGFKQISNVIVEKLKKYDII